MKNANQLRQMRYHLERARRVEAPLHKLDAEKRERLEAKPLDEFFSPEFLIIAYGAARDKSSLYISAPNVLRSIKSTWPEVRTVGDLVKKLPTGIYELAGLSGFGQAALVVIVESLCLFGYDIKFEPDVPERQVTDEMRKAWELANELGITE